MKITLVHEGPTGLEITVKVEREQYKRGLRRKKNRRKKTFVKREAKRRRNGRSGRQTRKRKGRGK